MKKQITLQSVLIGETWDSVKNGINSPFAGVKPTELSDEELYALAMKDEDYQKGRDLFLRVVRMMAEAILMKIPISDSKTINISLSIK